MDPRHAASRRPPSLPRSLPRSLLRSLPAPGDPWLPGGVGVMIAGYLILDLPIIAWLTALFFARYGLYLIARLPGPLMRIDMGTKNALIEVIIAGSAVILGITSTVTGVVEDKVARVIWIILFLFDSVTQLTRLFRSKDTGAIRFSFLTDCVPQPTRLPRSPDTGSRKVIIGIMIVASLIIIETIGSPHRTGSVEGKVVAIILTIGHLAALVNQLTGLFRRNDKGAEKVLVGILVGAVLLVGIMGSLSGTDASLENCKHAHRAAYAQAKAPPPSGSHRSLELDTNITNCPSAAKGDYGPCLRNSLNQSEYDGRVTYAPEDTMMFFLRHRPRLPEPPPRLSLFNILSSDQPSFDVSRLSPTQREGLVLWSKCTYPRFGQTLTQPLNLSCPFQAFNLLFFHNTMGDGQMFLPDISINPDPPPKYIDRDLQDVLAVSIPQKDPMDRVFTRRILHIGATPLLWITPVAIEHTPHNLAKILSQLLHEMLHVTQYIYTCPICSSDQCAALNHLDGPWYKHLWLPLTVAIDLMLAKEGVLEILGVNWKEYRLDLHADRVAAAMKVRPMMHHMQAELNGEEWDTWDSVSLRTAFIVQVVKRVEHGTLARGFPSWRPDPAPYMVA